MTVWNLGSINRDVIYTVKSLPLPGETIAASTMAEGLGGKGANQSVAAAGTPAKVMHIGAVGPEDDWARKALEARGVDVTHVAQAGEATGHAIINVDDTAENSIVIFAGANDDITPGMVRGALSGARKGDTLLLQNETSAQVEAAKLAREKGMRVIYSAAPFQVEAAKAVLPYCSMLAVNQIEADALADAFGGKPKDIKVDDLVVTRGSDGVHWFRQGGRKLVQPAISVTPVDTTGAGDTLIGCLAGLLDQGVAEEQALFQAAAAAALMVTRKGTIDAIPRAGEVDAFIAELD